MFFLRSLPKAMRSVKRRLLRCGRGLQGIHRWCTGGVRSSPGSIHRAFRAFLCKALVVRQVVADLAGSGGFVSYAVASYPWRMALRSRDGSRRDEATNYITSIGHGITYFQTR
jgi:hypothetical protein